MSMPSSCPFTLLPQEATWAPVIAVAGTLIGIAMILTLPFAGGL